MDTEVEIKEKLDIFIPQNIMNSIHTKIFKELLMGILISLYYILVDVLFLRGNEIVFTKSLNIVTVFLTISAIILLEVGFRKKEDKIFVRGLEIVILALITLFIPYVYLKRGKVFISLYSLSCLYISVYYAVKALIIYLNEVKRYRRGLSDVKEILKSSNESYLNEKNERKFKNIGDDDFNKKNRLCSVRITFDKIKAKTRRKITQLKDAQKLNEEKEIDPKMKINIEKKIKPKMKINIEKEIKPKKKINLDYDLEIKKSESKTKGKTPKKRGRKPTGKKIVKSMATIKTKNEEDK